MADRVLYFPSIQVPSNNWFARMLLYWDSVATIVPTAALGDPEILGTSTHLLIEEKLLEVVTPDNSLWAPSGPRGYRSAFLELIDRSPWLPRGAPAPERPRTKVYLDKTGHGLADDLVDRDLAHYVEGPEYAVWFSVEKQTAELLMAFLALILARSGPEPMVPITDRRPSLDALKNVRFESQGQENVLVDTDAIRTCLLRGVLPAPSAIRAAEIATFKSKHQKELSVMRVAVEQEVLKAALIDDLTYRERSLELSVTKLRQQTDEVRARMKESGWRDISVSNVVGAVGATVALADALVTGGVLTLAAASIGLLGASWGAYEGTRSKEDWLNRPMAYAAVAQRDFG